jgi:hypothetical protein
MGDPRLFTERIDRGPVEVWLDIAVLQVRLHRAQFRGAQGSDTMDESAMVNSIEETPRRVRSLDVMEHL